MWHGFIVESVQHLSSLQPDIILGYCISWKTCFFYFDTEKNVFHLVMYSNWIMKYTKNLLSTV